MTDTARITSELITLLGDTQPDHLTNRQLLRDTVTSFDKWRGAILNAKDAPYFATGDGSAIDSVAIRALVNDAYAAVDSGWTARMKVVFPPGVYMVDVTGIFTPTNVTSAHGVVFEGSGMYTSIIRFVSLSADTWLYDNGATARAQFPTFMHLGFEGADPASQSLGESALPVHAKGFKVTSASWEQGFRFLFCRAQYFDVLFDFEGTNTASEMKHFGCKYSHIRTTVYRINNVQSFNHEFISTDVEVIWGDIFDATSGLGGGSIKTYGGSWISFSKADGTPTYFFKASPASTGMGANPCTFSGGRMELRGNSTNLVSLGDVTQFDLVFDTWLFEDQTTADKANWCVVAGYSSVYFKNSGFYETSTGQINFVANAANRRGQSGTITFDACTVPVDLSDRCYVTSGFGQIRARNGCRGSNIGGSGSGTHWAHDFDLNWNAGTAGQVGVWAPSGGTLQDGGSLSDCSVVRKTVKMKLGAEFWPSITEHTLKLPKNSTLLGIHSRKPAGGSDSTVTTMVVGRNDKSGTPHLVSNSAAMSAVHQGDLDNYFYNVGNSVNERTLRLYSSAVTSGTIQGGECWVEYV